MIFEYTKINESYTILRGDKQTLHQIVNFLKAEKPDAHFNKRIQLGFEDRYVYFSKFINDQDLLIFNGHRSLLNNYNIGPDCGHRFTEDEVETFLNNTHFPFKPYDYQIKNIKMGLMNTKMLFKSCTGSGKSLTISTILEFFRIHELKGVLIVPNINLLTQFKSDIESYNFDELNKQIRLFGNGNKSNFDTCLTITTWQSLQKEIPNLDKLHFDYIIVDEAHKSSADVLKDIILKSINTPIKLGFTGTIPNDPVAKMTLVGLFGAPETIITSKDLISRGLATPVKIQSMFLDYSPTDKERFFNIPREAYLKQLEFLKLHESRQRVIVQIAMTMRSKNKNVLILFQHTEHGKDIFERIIHEIHPGLNIDESMIIGKTCMEFQREYKVYFMNGEQSAKIREEQRNLMEQNDGVILIANYSVASTGINIRNLHSLIFASPLKAFTTVSQSLGRLMRKHKNKSESVIFDLVDNFGYRKPSGIFVNQYKHRLSSSYIPEEFEVNETHIRV